ncbi:hypothetical protein DOTSEDRAFT_130545 [Dothistroma septosporum NZE10]|uniref:BTB domain-containing protein n=1 Tax=Dothistroma septosporum (strain NZE10 / CBS 128990) TaxID=675120 RepID=N1PL71_DOTSN|nr:hypothetical protein DOTSEDRAFT_130545 [Dothistroma septosporum NZE10]
MVEPTPQKAFCNRLARFAGNGALSDFTITCKGKKWPVHRLVLSLQSPVLAKSCGGEFSEAHQKQHDLSEHEVEHVNQLVAYLYHFQYDAFPSHDPSENACFHVNMCLIGDKYDISNLQRLASREFASCITGIPDYARGLVDAIKLAYSVDGPTAEIRKAIIKQVIDGDLVAVEGEGKNILEDLMESYPRFAIEVVRAQNVRRQEEQEKENGLDDFRCPCCFHFWRAEIPDDNEEGGNDPYRCQGCGFERTCAEWHLNKVDFF